MRTGNPVLAAERFDAVRDDVDADTGTMTVMGTVHRSIVATLVCVAAAAFVWSRFFAHHDVIPLLLGGLIGGVVIGMVLYFKPSWSPVLVLPYAAAEGLALGGFSAMIEVRYPGIPLQAVTVTIGTLFAVLFAYRVGLVRATAGFKMGVIAATGALALVYTTSFFLRFFLGVKFPFIHESSPIGIAFSVVAVGIAALNFVLDFDLIERQAEERAPKYMEWYCAYGLLATLVWLYIEVLKLLMKLQDRRER